MARNINQSSIEQRKVLLKELRQLVVATIATAIPTLVSVRMLPWARTNLNHTNTAQALIIRTVAGASYFVVADKTIRATARRNSFKQGLLADIPALSATTALT